ncbi:MAG: polyprenyl synthetase family protein [Chloroflexi bacterium]|nr:polyprenyl synthetase family protein [Chloroflexota bacterium]
MTDITQTFLSAIETELQRQVARLDQPHTAEFHSMLTYHMGWTGEGAGPRTTGKRIRPLLVLLTAAASSKTGAWQDALPAAAAVELVHNFSLVHDDIQDNSDTRRGRATVWVKWGMPQAINAGDGLFILANLAMSDLENGYPAGTVVRAARILQNTCLDLTRGQYLDISYETRADLDIESYWPMIAGKTAALLSACTEIGALLGGADEGALAAYRDFGRHLGLAFQVQDDYLGIWGDSALTGKSTASDLVAGKKSLPVLYGLAQNGDFAKRWHAGPVAAGQVSALAEQLALEGGRDFTRRAADQLTGKALDALREAAPQGEAGGALFALADRLLGRQA